MVSFSDHTSIPKGDIILHGQPYNTRHAVPSILHELCRKYGVSRAGWKYNKTAPISASGKPAGTEKPLACRPDPSAYSSADFLDKLVKRYARRGIEAEYV